MKLSRGASRDNLFNSFFRCPSALALICMKLFNVCACKLSLSLCVAHMGAEPGRRFLKHPAAKLEPVIVGFYKERRIPAAGAFHWSWHQLKNFKRRGMTYELLLEIFSMEKLKSLLYRNCSVNFFTELLHFALPLELTRVGMLDVFPLHVTVCCKPRDCLRQKPR